MVDAEVLQGDTHSEIFFERPVPMTATSHGVTRLLAVRWNSLADRTDEPAPVVRRPGERVGIGSRGSENG